MSKVEYNCTKTTVRKTTSFRSIVITSIISFLLGALILFAVFFAFGFVNFGFGPGAQRAAEAEFHAYRRAYNKTLISPAQWNTSDELMVEFKKIEDDLARYKEEAEGKKPPPYQFKRFTPLELEAAISKRYLRDHPLNDRTKAVIIATLHDALNEHTSADGLKRNNYEVCRVVADKLDKELGLDWACIMGNFESSIEHPENLEFVYFELDNREGVEIFKIKHSLTFFQA